MYMNIVDFLKCNFMYYPSF